MGAVHCHRNGMEYLSLETKKEEQNFLKLCSNESGQFDNFNFLGGTSDRVSSNSGWYWISTGKPVNYKLQFNAGEPNNHLGEELCLSTNKDAPNRCGFNDVQCAKLEVPHPNYFNYRTRILCQEHFVY